ncbi:type IV-A pilus assembly ATPase PilB [Desulfurobacterium atlanticum]|uniref:Type IV pilus assembly protein PilB n=1 Tax=Desulfurobacterium atlanticum TaxID=240169 RepID=A0A238XU73_9BACT|nr:type IV-A pilus assembly ATPase PilB [Desulfurobacterium atlanticum]SNR62061.1 type IV pilus assembly protein PilB [Desulfurobacterium atlanticum]
MDKNLIEQIEKRLIASGIPKETIQKLKTSEGDFFEQLIKNKLIDETELLEMLSQVYNVPFVDLREIKPSEDVIKLIPQSTAEKNMILPIGRIGPNLKLAMADPSDLQTIEKLRFSTGFKIEPFVALPFRIKQKLEEVYGKIEEDFFSKLKQELLSEKETAEAEELEEETPSKETVVSLDNLKQLATQAPIVKLVNAIVLEALKRGASDIHIEPFEKELRIRYRIDGVLHIVGKYSPEIKDAVAARFKVLSNLDIAEKRLPQDGRMSVKYKGRKIDFRVSTLPTIFGEKIVLRILDKGNLQLDLSKLGLEDREYKLLLKAIKAPYGMVLVTGPTGSGKTTTLYSSLLTVNTPEVNIMTAEDPVEYNLYGINQVQIKHEIGLDFARVLRAFLRQDPDIIMVGEIRDKETAQIAIESALTGHLVFSTLHTNDAPSTVTRLIDMGIESFLVSSSVLIVIAQRLARKICSHCKEPYKYPLEVLMEVGFSKEEAMSVKTYKGKGCEYCNGSGYKGRVGLYEVLEMTHKVRDAILKGKTSDDIRQIAKLEGMRTLRDIGRIKIAKGYTTPEEVLRVTREY